MSHSASPQKRSLLPFLFHFFSGACHPADPSGKTAQPPKNKCDPSTDSSAFVARFVKCKDHQNLITFEDELRLRWRILWIRALLKATSLTDINREYIAWMVIHLANTTAILCEFQDIAMKDLMSACVYFYEERNAIGIVKEWEEQELTIIKGNDGCKGDTFIEAL